jgi:hypothetical protein
MFLGWYDPNKKKAAAQKLAEAIARYQEKFTAEPTEVLCHPIEAEELRVDVRERDLIITGVHYIPRHTFYVGVTEAEERRLND